MKQGKPVTEQYRCSLCGKCCTCVIELHEHEKGCVETQLMLRSVGLRRPGQILLKRPFAQVRIAGANRL